MYSLYFSNIYLGLSRFLFFSINPFSIICFLKSLSGITILSLFIFFSNALIYLPKYNNFISYIFSLLLLLISFISFISKEENGKNNTSFSSGINDNFSMSACVDKL